MITANVKWTERMRFSGTGNSGHEVVTDGESKVANSPMELVLIALCGCTASDVVDIQIVKGGNCADTIENVLR